MKDIAELLARILIAFVFIYEALDAIVFFNKTKATMTAYGIVWQQDLLLKFLIGILLVGGVLVLIGYHARLGAVLLLLYWLPYTLIVYSFWDDAPDYKRIHAIYFMRNLAIIGSLLLLIANGAGRFSIKRLIYIMKLPR
ncbi:MAG TPA: DoxX family protein [Saprospiraceae bacterium]|nr:DoxX family protein [Saprospiraceae bacterium]HRO07458.1 DoxX family protein [Saprospiraceae bacterium]HRP40741.1 DoxX family protein [Saprospiraceae bacterium]